VALIIWGTVWSCVFIRQDDCATVISNIRSKSLTMMMFIALTPLALRPVLIAVI